MRSHEDADMDTDVDRLADTALNQPWKKMRKMMVHWLSLVVLSLVHEEVDNRNSTAAAVGSNRDTDNKAVSVMGLLPLPLLLCWYDWVVWKVHQSDPCLWCQSP